MGGKGRRSGMETGLIDWRTILVRELQIHMKGELTNVR